MKTFTLKHIGKISVSKTLYTAGLLAALGLNVEPYKGTLIKYKKSHLLLKDDNNKRMWLSSNNIPNFLESLGYKIKSKKA